MDAGLAPAAGPAVACRALATAGARALRCSRLRWIGNSGVCEGTRALARVVTTHASPAMTRDEVSKPVKAEALAAVLQQWVRPIAPAGTPEESTRSVGEWSAKGDDGVTQRVAS